MSTPGGNMTNVLIDKARADRERRRSGRSRITALTTLAVVGGLGLLLALTVGGDPNESPTCDDKTMARGDTCVIYSSRGGGGSFSYDEMVDRSESSDSVLRGIGFGLAGLCAVLMVPVAIRLDPATPGATRSAGPVRAAASRTAGSGRPRTASPRAERPRTGRALSRCAPAASVTYGGPDAGKIVCRVRSARRTVSRLRRDVPPETRRRAGASHLPEVQEGAAADFVDPSSRKALS